MMPSLISAVLDPILLRALEEDLASGDVTTDACIPVEARARADARARGEIVVCGGPVFSRVFALVDASVKCEAKLADGAIAKAGDVLWSVEGSARSLLMVERAALNFVQRMSGIATTTRAYVAAVPKGSSTRIIDTRKTTPGLRVLERYAVRAGGGMNHRDNLGSAVLIKDNHVAACGGVGKAIERARAHAPHTSKIECEVDSLAQLDEALAAGADIVLLDNMSTADVAEAVRRSKGKAFTEVSGGITLARVAELAKAGVDAIWVGALTHSITSADIGLDFAMHDFENLADLIREQGGELGAPLELLEETTSTNDVAKRAAKNGAPHGATFVADSQTAGRGRQGRSWLSARGESILMSTILRVSCAPARLPPLSLVAGLAVAEAIAPAVDVTPRIKWPNDVWLVEKKTAGVLVEASIAGDKVEWLVVGVGINVHTRHFPAEIEPIATSVALHAKAPPSRATIAARVLTALDREMVLAATHGLGSVHERLRDRDALFGRHVRSDSGEGIADGIDLEGRLRVKKSDALYAWTAGEVNLVR